MNHRCATQRAVLWRIWRNALSVSQIEVLPVMSFLCRKEESKALSALNLEVMIEMGEKSVTCFYQILQRNPPLGILFENKIPPQK